MKVRVMFNAQLLNSPEINRAGPAIGAIYNIALFQQKLRQVGAVLTSDSCDDGFHAWSPRVYFTKLLYKNCRDSRSEEHKSELQSLMRISYAVFCLKQKKTNKLKLTREPKHNNQVTEQK